jgi:hypothetical protein
MKDELITRLQNACAQRDEARAQVMELENRLQKAAADFAHQQEETNKAVAAAAAAAAAGAEANGGAPIDVSVIGRMGKGASAALQQLAAQGPGMARMMVEAANSYLQPGAPGAPAPAAPGARAAAAAAGAGPSAAMLAAGPEHVPGQPAIPGGRISGPGAAPETELERRTRELQVGRPAGLGQRGAEGRGVLGCCLFGCRPRGLDAVLAPFLASPQLSHPPPHLNPQAKQLALMQERRRQEEERLLAALPQPMGFHKGRPMAALVVFRCCLQWRAFQADRTSVFDRIIHVIGAQIERHQEDNPRLCYWLTNTTTLLFLLQRNIKPASSGSLKGRAAAAGRAAGSMLNSWLGRGASMGGGEASIHGGGVGGFRLVEAKYPALLFKQQLDAFVQKIFPMLRDNVKKAITPLLVRAVLSGGGLGADARRARGCPWPRHPQHARPLPPSLIRMHPSPPRSPQPRRRTASTRRAASAGARWAPAAAPRRARSRQWRCLRAARRPRRRRRARRGPRFWACWTASSPTCAPHSSPSPWCRCARPPPPPPRARQPPAAAGPRGARALAPGQRLPCCAHPTALTDAHSSPPATPLQLPPPQALFRQLFAFINVQLFNQLLLRRECCSFSNGEYVKTGLAQVGGA